MFTYFIPIGLLVLAGFALGLIVGRLAWASTRSSAKKAETADEVPAAEERSASSGPRSVFRHSAPDLPTWRMRQIDSIPETTPGDVAYSSDWFRTDSK